MRFSGAHASPKTTKLYDRVSELDKASEPWGVKVLRYEIKNINPPQDVLAAMEKQMRAEREKRAVILTSEGQRDAAINTAEGEKQRTIKESEARRQQQINEAEAILAVAISAPGGVEATRRRDPAPHRDVSVRIWHTERRVGSRLPGQLRGDHALRPRCSEGAILSSVSWSEKRQAGHYLDVSQIK